MQFLKKAPAHIFLLAALFLLDIAKDDKASLDIGDLLLAWLSLTGICLLIYGAISIITKHRVAAAVATTFLLFILSYYLPLLVGFGAIARKIGFERIARHMIIMPLIVVLGAGMFIYAARSKKEPLRLNAYLNVLLAILVILNLANITRTAMAGQSATERNPVADEESFPTLAPIPQPGRIHLGYLPDIYFIILDSYTSSENLEKYWHFNNSEFDRFLENAGFYLARHSRASMPSTLHSISSELNTKAFVPSTPGPELLVDIGNNRVCSFLKELGYQLVNYSIFDIAGEERFYDFSPFRENQSIIEKAFYRSLVGTVKRDLIDIRSGIQKQFEIMNSLAAGDFACNHLPSFIYAHFLISHPPSYVDRNGNILRVRRASQEEGYLDQISFINMKMEVIVRAILAKPDQLPIIIIQGDHGSRLLKGADGDEESHSVFNAFFLPHNDYGAYIADMSPVDTMKMIMSQYFNYK